MSAANKFARAFSLRDKRSARGHSGTRSGGPDFNGLLTLDSTAKKSSKEDEKKIQDLTHQLAMLGFAHIPEARIEYAVRTKTSDGDVKKALRLLLLFEDSVAGILKKYDPDVKMVGAENREKVTCYLDALLFAMFAKPDVFEAILFNNFNDERKRLVTILRLWVNMLRAGRLITTDITAHLQQSLAECGWPDAAKVRQQDASEAFGFITDKLELPLLTLKTDLFHSGKEDASDDHKFITERLLEVAIPESIPQDQTITLEMCLEEYFNNRVEVKRHLQRRNTVQSMKSTGSVDKGDSTLVEVVEVGSRSNSPMPADDGKPTPTPQRPTHMRERATSIFSERRVEIISDGHSGDKDATSNGLARKRTSSVRKEVSMPAWQFLNLIPWYTNNLPEGDAQRRSHFAAKRPMLGICLKRYSFSKNGTHTRLNTYIDVPLEMASPYFASGDDLGRDGLPTRKFKLSLQSVVCHRGISVDSGHYIALLRAGPPAGAAHDSFSDVTDTQVYDPSHDTWLCFDDLANERVRHIDIKKALRDESPYLLFYQVEPIDPEPLDEDNPPPYTESTDSFDLVDRKLALMSEQGSRTSLDAEEPRSIRASLDTPRPTESRGRSSVSEQRRSSLVLPSGSVSGGNSIKYSSPDPTIAPEENRSEGSSLSRQHTKNSKRDGGIRTSTDASERRFSMSMHKITSRLSRANPDIIVDEAGTEEPAQVAAASAAPQAGSPVPHSAPTTVAKPARDESHDDAKSKSKDKERKKIFKSMSRRGSGGQLLEKGKEPERDCILM